MVDKDAVGHLLELLRQNYETLERVEQITKTARYHRQQPVVATHTHTHTHNDNDNEREFIQRVVINKSRTR